MNIETMSHASGHGFLKTWSSSAESVILQVDSALAGMELTNLEPRSYNDDQVYKITITVEKM